MSYLSWHVGTRVVCVDDENQRFGDVLKRGCVYTVREMVVVPNGYCDTGQIGVRLVEITLPCDLTGNERGHKASRFRPVQKRKIDISVFTAMLHDKKERVDA